MGVIMKHKGLITVFVLIIMTITVTVCEDAEGMEHTEDNHTKCVVISKKVKDKKGIIKGKV